MKKIIGLTVVSIFALNVFAANPWKDKFCAKMKDGKTIVMHNNKELTSDYIASNGVKIQTDGTVIRKDGSTFLLKDGQCVNTEGNLEKKGLMKKESRKDKEREPSSY